MVSYRRRSYVTFLIGSFILLFQNISSSWAGNGAFLHGVGAIDSALGGSTTALPQDAIGTLFNNVGSVTELRNTGMDFGVELLKSQPTVGSTVGGVSGETNGRSSISPIPSFGFVWPRQHVTAFVGALGVGGFGVNYPQDNENPIFKPPVQNGVPAGGFGHVYSSYQLATITAGLAVRITDRLSIGFAPNLGYATLSAQPMAAVTPDCAGQVCVYPNASDRASALGVGFQMGLYYKFSDFLRVGASYTSPKWFQSFNWNSQNANPVSSNFGVGRQLSFQLDAPQVIGFGLAVYPNQDWSVSVGAKWFNYANTKGYEDEGFDSTGAIKGLGWKDIWAFSIGTQYSIAEKLVLRAGYNFSQNPITGRNVAFNVPSPAIVQHHLAFGIGYNLTNQVEFNFAYYHAFANTVTGPLMTPAGSMAGTVSSRLSYDSVLFQLTLKLKS